MKCEGEATVCPLHVCQTENKAYLRGYSRAAAPTPPMSTPAKPARMAGQKPNGRPSDGTAPDPLNGVYGVGVAVAAPVPLAPPPVRFAPFGCEGSIRTEA